MKNAKKQEIPQCIYDDEEFAEAIKEYTDKIDNCQFEIGRLVHFYIKQHGNKYGSDTYAHIAEIADIPDDKIRSLYNYHNLYRLETKFKFATLQNLTLGVKYEIARLLGHPKADKIIPELAEISVKQKLSRRSVAKEVTSILDFKEPQNEVKNNKSTDNAHATELWLTTRQMGSLSNAVDVLKLMSRDDVKIVGGAPNANTERVIAMLVDGAARYMEKKISEKEVYNLEPYIELFHDRFEAMCKKIRKQLKNVS